MPATSELVCDSHRAALDRAGQPLLVLPRPWGGLPLGVFPLPQDEQRGPTFTPHPVLVMVLSGGGQRWYRHGSRTVELSIAAQHMDLMASRYERDHGRWKAERGLTVGVHLRPEALARLTHDPALEVETRHELRDARLSWLVSALHDEAQRGAPGGPLLAEGLSIALIAWLREQYGRRPAPPRTAGGLTAVQQRRVREFVQAHLGAELSVSRLAQEAALSPDHFARLFRTSFGCSPYRWVQQCRIDEAMRQLRQSDAPIADIALALGFSSQSHLTHVFRQLKGTTPGQVRG